MAIELILSRLDRTEVDPLEVNLAVLKRACSGRSYGGVSREVRERAGEGERVGNAFLRSLSLPPASRLSFCSPLFASSSVGTPETGYT